MSELNPSWYYTPRQAAQFLGLPLKTVRQMYARRQVECYKPWGAVLVRGDVIQAWINAQHQKRGRNHE